MRGLSSEGLNEAQDSLHSQLSKVQDASVSGTFKHDAKICSVAWSPAAACPANACLLATVDTDSKVQSICRCLPSRLVFA